MKLVMPSEIKKGGESMAGLGVGIFLTAVYIIIPLVIFYFIMKLAIKNAIKELKGENIL